MRINALTNNDIESIYELTYKYQMLKQEAALGDYGLPQQLPDNAYMAFEKVKQELNSKLDDVLPDFQRVFSDWLEHHITMAGEDLFLSIWEDTQGGIYSAKSYSALLKIFTEDEIKEVLVESNTELAQYNTLEEIVDYTETLSFSEEIALFKQVKDTLAQHPALSQIVEDRVVQEEGNYYDETAIGDVQSMLDKIENAYGWKSEASLDDRIIIFQEALTTAHNNGSMAEYLLADPGAVEFLSRLSNDPIYAEKWNQDLAKLLGYPVGSRLAPKQEWFSAHLKKAIKMIASLLKRA
jgi:hypothetical protein